MAVSISRTADPAGASASSNIATYSNQSIGTAAEDRIVCLVVTSELTSASPNSATIDFGTGAQSMNASTQGNFGAVYARIFWLPAPTGTTATFAVTFGANPSNVQNHVSVYRVVGARPSLTTGGNGSTDMDATAPLTTGSITIATNGGFLAVAAGATSSTAAKTWANATEDLEVSGGNFCHTTATRTTALTTTAVTCTGGTNGEDGAMSWAIFTPGTLIEGLAGSYALTGTAATLKYGRKVAADAGSYALTGTAATLKKGYPLAAGAGSYALTGTAATLKFGRKAAAAAGSYAVTGTDATLKFGRKAAATAGSYALTGTDATLKYGRKAAAAAGSYALTGQDVTLSRTYKVAAETGSYILTGQDVALKRGFVVSATSGSYDMTGQDASLIYTPTGAIVLTPDAGSYELTGQDASLIHGFVLSAGSDTYVMTGEDATLIAPAQPEPQYTGPGGWWGVQSIYDDERAKRWEKVRDANQEIRELVLQMFEDKPVKAKAQKAEKAVETIVAAVAPIPQATPVKRAAKRLSGTLARMADVAEARQTQIDTARRQQEALEAAVAAFIQAREQQQEEEAIVLALAL